MSETKYNSGIKVIDFLNVYKEKKKFIFGFTLIVGLITAVLVFLVIDPVFLSTGSIKTANKSGGLGSLLGGGIPDLGEIGNITGELGSATKELALYENILTSRRCIEETITKFDLNSEWEFKYNTDAIKFFRQNYMEITKDKMAGTMDIGIYDTDPVRAKDVVDFLIYQLNRINTDLNIQSAKNNKDFIEQRYNIVKEDLKTAEENLKNFQNINGMAPHLLVKAVAESEIRLEIEIKSEEVKLDILRKILSPDQAEIKTQEQKIISLNQQLEEIKNSPAEKGTLALKGAPDMVLNYYRLERDIEIQNKILTFIIPLYEQAKIEEKKETPSLLVLDNPNIPDRKIKPKRLTLTLISLLIAFIASLLFFIFKRKWYEYKNIYSI